MGMKGAAAAFLTFTDLKSDSSGLAQVVYLQITGISCGQLCWNREQRRRLCRLLILLLCSLFQLMGHKSSRNPQAMASPTKEMFRTLESKVYEAATKAEHVTGDR